MKNKIKLNLGEIEFVYKNRIQNSKTACIPEKQLAFRSLIVISA